MCAKGYIEVEWRSGLACNELCVRFGGGGISYVGGGVFEAIFSCDVIWVFFVFMVSIVLG